MGPALRCLRSQCVEDRLYRVAGKASVDRRLQCPERRGAGSDCATIEHSIDQAALGPRPCERRDRLIHSIVLDIMGGKAAIEGVFSVQSGAGQSEITADMSRAAV